MPSRAWVVTLFIDYTNNHLAVSMPSRAWVVTQEPQKKLLGLQKFQCPLGLELLRARSGRVLLSNSCFNALSGLSCYQAFLTHRKRLKSFNALSGLSCYVVFKFDASVLEGFNALSGLSCYFPYLHLMSALQQFQCPLGLELLRQECPIF